MPTLPVCTNKAQGFIKVPCRDIACHCIQAYCLLPRLAAKLCDAPHQLTGKSSSLKLRGNAQNMHHGYLVVLHFQIPCRIMIFRPLVRHYGNSRRNCTVFPDKVHRSGLYVPQYHFIRRMPPINPAGIAPHILGIFNGVPIKLR